jgi:hypothetical protein
LHHHTLKRSEAAPRKTVSLILNEVWHPTKTVSKNNSS